MKTTLSSNQESSGLSGKPELWFVWFASHQLPGQHGVWFRYVYAETYFGAIKAANLDCAPNQVKARQAPRVPYGAGIGWAYMPDIELHNGRIVRVTS